MEKFNIQQIIKVNTPMKLIIQVKEYKIANTTEPPS